MNFDAYTIVYILEILVGGLLVGIGVHFVPVGGAPAAMASARAQCSSQPGQA